MSHITCMGVDRLHELFEADFENGTLVWRKSGKPAGGAHKEGYMAVWVRHEGKRHGLLVHRVLWAMKHGAWPAQTVDHRDRCRTNNSADNLREATYSEQNANRAALRAGLKGATLDKATGRWTAQIYRGGRNHFLGRHDSEQQAHDAYMQAARQFHGEFASC